MLQCIISYLKTIFVQEMVPEQIQEMITEDLTPDSDVFLAIYLDATPDVIEPEAWFVHLRL